MKEYLRRNAGGTYSYVGVVHHEHVHDLLIEIPEGATAARLCEDIEFYKNDFGVFFSRTSGNWINTISPRGALMENIVWQRKPPFSINDQYAEIEQVRQESQAWANRPVGRCRTVPFDETSLPDLSFEDTIKHPSHNHYFIDVSDVDEVDFYEIALRYNVTDPCIQHILKKCLAVGNRGHKDFHTDLKDIYDTAARALRIHGG